MIPELRQAYNAAFTAERYRALQEWIDAEAGAHVPFRIAETPVFLPAALTAKLERAAHEVLAAVRAPDYLRAAERAVPPGYRVPGEDAHTTFLQIDLALAVEDGRVVPRLIELQGFPSLYAFQWLLARGYRRHFALPAGMTPYFGGHDDASYVESLRQLIVGHDDPKTVVLLEIEPERQKTRVDFLMTEKLLGIPTVGLDEVVVRGRQAFYRERGDRGGGGRAGGAGGAAAGGREIPIRRIYNRVIFDELARRGIERPPLFRADLDLAWVGHPNWFWKISKFSLPFIRSQYAPPCHFLSELRELPDDLDSYVLKPLFSFAGLGVEIGVTAERLRAISRPEDYILQRRIEYAPAVVTPDDPAKVEVRMMFAWRDRPLLINNLVRMTKGKMVGVDFNKDRSWVGSSVALHQAGPGGPA
jgi:hypothetical protein